MEPSAKRTPKQLNFSLVEKKNSDNNCSYIKTPNLKCIKVEGIINVFNPNIEPIGSYGNEDDDKKINLSERLKTEGKGDSELDCLSESMFKPEDDEADEGIPMISKCVVERNLVKKTNNMRISILKIKPFYESSNGNSKRSEEGESASQRKPIFFQPRVPTVLRYLPCLYMEPLIEGGKGVIVFFHGNGEDLNHSYEILNFLKVFTRVKILPKKKKYFFKVFLILFLCNREKSSPWSTLDMVYTSRRRNQMPER